VILARPEIPGATGVVTVIAAGWGIRRAISRAPIAYVPITAPNPQLARDMRAGGIADDAASDESDRARGDGTRDRSQGRVGHAFAGAGDRRRKSDGESESERRT
jgi:hypothetical protein